MELRKIPEEAVQVGSHWEWQDGGLTFHGWADENGYLHREGAPARIEYRKDGTIRGEVWYLHGKIHREGGPARIVYRKDGRTISSEQWYLHGEEHREGAPAYIAYHKDGRTISSEQWYLHGQPHREGAPAYIAYREDGHTIWSESWWLHGQDTEPLYPPEAYEDLQKEIGHEAMWALPENLIRLLLAFF